MEFEKCYVLFQFNAVLGDKEFEKIQAVKFRYVKGMDIEKEINSYADSFMSEYMDRAWREIRPELNELGVNEIYDLLKKFYLGCSFCFEAITKEDYKGWREEGKASKIYFN